MTGALIGTVRDAQGGAVRGAEVQVSSPALIGSPALSTTNDTGHLWFPALPPGVYKVDVKLAGFAPYHQANIRIVVGGTRDLNIKLDLDSHAETVVVEGADSRIEARDPGLSATFGSGYLGAIPSGRLSMFDPLRATPGISPTSPSSRTTTTISSFGSATNENQFLIDGTNHTCPCNGIARAEPGVDFIQEIYVQSVGASAEFGNVQGAVVNVITRQGSDRFLFDAAYRGQPAGLTSQPVLLRSLATPQVGSTGYVRGPYRDFTTSLGGPVVRNRVWFFVGYQFLRDYDSQPGTDAARPRTYDEHRTFVKVTSRPAEGWQLMQSVHYERGVNPTGATYVTSADAVSRPHLSVPAITFGDLTHSMSANTVWEVRAGRFDYSRVEEPSTGDWNAASHFDRATAVTTGAPPILTTLRLSRTTAKATLTHYQPRLWGADHQWKVGGQAERGEHESPAVIPSGARYVDNAGAPFQKISSAPSNTGGEFITVGLFATDAVTVGDRVTFDAGLRFDHARAISQDLQAVDAQANETGDIIHGLGTLYTWNDVSPRLGLVLKISADGRTIARASYGRFYQGVLTGEIGTFHPGATPTRMAFYDAATGDYTSKVTVVDPKVNLKLDPGTRAPYTDEYSIDLDREFGRGLMVSVAYVRKHGADFIGWTDIAGTYVQQTRPLPDGGVLPVFVLTSASADRRFLLANQAGYSLTYNGVVAAFEKRQSHGWEARGSYTWSRATGLIASSGAVAAGAQVSTVAPPPPPNGLTFGRDPNDLTNARGLLPNDRPHIFRAMSSVNVPRTGLVVAGSLQYFIGKPWAASTQVTLPQGDLRILIEPRGSERLSSQTLLDFRVSKAFPAGRLGRVELLCDVLNALNDTAEEGLATDNISSSSFASPTVFLDPRRVMLGVKFNLGR
ncbi:MAG TPA: TonB-dependent receptor [Vicinamibacterales bacterium]|nr:TonB-dependent receptor [Vicinamibacterales bacterium]